MVQMAQPVELALKVKSAHRETQAQMVRQGPPAGTEQMEPQVLLAPPARMLFRLMRGI
jgi:hypothetical protein